MVTQALLAALALYIVYICRHVVSWMSDRPIVAATLTGILLGDVATGAIVGANLEILYLGVQNIGGPGSTDTGFSACFGAAVSIMFGYTWEQALVIAIPAGLIGLTITQLAMLIKGLLVPLFDNLIESDRGKLYSFLFLGLGLLIDTIRPILVFVGLYAGSAVLSGLVENMPAWLSLSMTAAGAMLPAVGMGILLSFMWNKRLVIYLILGFSIYAFTKWSMIFIAVIAATIAVADFMRSREIAALQDGGTKMIESGEEEDFFNE